MFSNLELFIILNDYKKSESLSKRLNIPIPETELSSLQLTPSVNVQESSLPLPPVESKNIVPDENPPWLPAETQNTGSEESQTVLPIDIVFALPTAPQAEPHIEPQPSLPAKP